MLLKIERTILQKISSSIDCSIELSEIGKYSGEDVHQAFLSLQDKGYVTNVTTSIENSTFCYEITTKGRFYKEYIFMWILRNILIPFIVSVITATATYHLEKITDGNTDSSSTYRTYKIYENSDPGL